MQAEDPLDGEEMVTVNANTILSLLEMNNSLTNQLHPKRKVDEIYNSQSSQYSNENYSRHSNEFESRLQFQVMRYIFPMVNNNFSGRMFTVDDFAQLICKDAQKLQFINALSNQYSLPVDRFIDKSLEILCRLNFLQELDKDKFIISTRCGGKILHDVSSPEFSESSSESVIDSEVPVDRVQKKARIETDHTPTEEPSAWPCWTEKEPKSPEEHAPEQKKRR